MKKNNIYKAGLSVMLVMSFLIQPANASGDEEVKAVNETDIAAMELSNPGASGINLIIYDRTDRVVYENRIPSGSTIEDAFDFSVAQQGTYRVVKQLEDINFIRVFNVQSNGVVLPQSYYSFTPQFNPEEKLLRIRFLNSSQNQVRIEISDFWDTVFEDSYREPGKEFAMSYDLESFPAGTYSFQLTSGLEEFSYTFEVK